MADHLGIELAKGITVSKYLDLKQNKNKTSIAEFIKNRFTERYITPLKSSPPAHGFCIMAICCLMVEALESFRKGWKDTNGKSGDAFSSFFKNNSNFGEFQHIEFYKNIRCGILHQAETTGGWRIRRDGQLLDQSGKTINATKFLKELVKSLDNYCGELETADWDSELWKNFRKKMDAVCDNCKENVGSRT